MSGTLYYSRKANDLRDCASGGSCKQAKSGHNIIYCYNQIYSVGVIWVKYLFYGLMACIRQILNN